MSKPITSVAALTLVEQGRIALADPISRSIPEIRHPVAGGSRERPGHDLPDPAPGAGVGIFRSNNRDRTRRSRSSRLARLPAGTYAAL
ncbi:hypothetical protein [Bradyrhizobium liaoningense]